MHDRYNSCVIEFCLIWGRQLALNETPYLDKQTIA